MSTKIDLDQVKDVSTNTIAGRVTAGSGELQALTAEQARGVLNVEDGAEANTIDSNLTGEPAGSAVVLNVVQLTQAQYDAGTPVATTLYIITDA